MTIKQLKLSKLFRKKATPVTEDHEELQEEIQQLEQTLRDKQNELFQIQRNSYRCKALPAKKKSEPIIKPENIVLANQNETLKGNLELMAMLSGMEVKLYVAGKHCAVVYNMQHRSTDELKHGVRIDMEHGNNDVSEASLPLGFNLSAVTEGFDNNAMQPACLIGIKRALIAYYSRLEQYDQLKKLLNIQAKLFKILDGSHIEIEFPVINEHHEEEDQIHVKLVLDYRVHDIRPKQYTIVDKDMPEGAGEILKDQCIVFKKKPLHKAFKEAFIEGNGTYVMVQQFGSGPVVPQKRRNLKRQRPADPRYDDTFHPEDCSAIDDEDHFVS